MSWYNQSGPNMDVVTSTRIRLARNINGLPFPKNMNESDRKKLNDTVKKALNNCDLRNELTFIDMDCVPENERYSMVERHIISYEFAKNYKGRAVLLSKDETVCVMIGEEDHIRIQVILPGLDLEKAYALAEKIDNELISQLDIAFSKDLGFLTECLTNVGTGLRASVMLHLPIIEKQGEISSVSNAVGKFGFTIRGMYGEGSKATASLYQISNQVTLGISEGTALERLKAIAENLIQRERAYRNELDKTAVEDAAFRALAILKNARILSSNEMMMLLSNLNIGLGLGIIKGSSSLPFNIFISAQPAMLMRKSGNMTAHDRDCLRAEYVREMLCEIN